MSSRPVLTSEQFEMVGRMKQLIGELEVMNFPEESNLTQKDYPNIPMLISVAKENIESAHRLCKNMIGEIVERS